MISCRLKGGIGNMMFQIAAIENMANDNNLEAGYYNVKSQIELINKDVKHNPHLDHAEDYLKMFKNFKWNQISPPRKKVMVPFHYEKINVQDNVIYDGFFQSEKYFKNRKFTLNLFEPSEFVKKQLKKYTHIFNGTTCSIHVRRGDYLKFSMHIVRDSDYYSKAIKEIGDVDNYLIFSDDIEWCKENFLGEKCIFIENEKDYVEIFLQSMCTHNIISSSSFSWWGAYLNKNENKKVVGPKQWFNGGKFESKDIIPEKWIKV